MQRYEWPLKSLKFIVSGWGGLPAWVGIHFRWAKLWSISCSHALLITLVSLLWALHHTQPSSCCQASCTKTHTHTQGRSAGNIAYHQPESCCQAEISCIRVKLMHSHCISICSPLTALLFTQWVIASRKNSKHWSGSDRCRSQHKASVQCSQYYKNCSKVFHTGITNP